MDIRLVWDGSKLMVHPQEAEVVMGEEVSWLALRNENGYLMWNVRFRSGTPFEWNKALFELAMKPGTDKDILKAGRAVRDGTYKYDVIVQQFETRKVLCEDDPYLIVRSR